MIFGYRRLFILAFLGIAVLFCGCQRKTHAPLAEAGRIDLTGWDFERDGVVKLAGQWAFYPDQLLLPGELAGAAFSRAAYLVMPSFRTKGDGGGYFGGGEHATLRLAIKLPDVSTPLTLAAWGPKSAMRLWVNGRLAAEDGKVGTHGKSETPGRRTVAFIPLDPRKISGHTVELVLQLSAYHGDPLGAVDAFRLGSAPRMAAQWERSRAFLICFVTILLLMGCYHLSLFAFRTTDPSPLYFGLFCLMWMTHFASFGGNRWLVYALLPNLGYMAVDRMEMIGYIFSVPFIIYFYRALFPDETPPRLSAFFPAAAGMLSLWLLSGLGRRAVIAEAAHSISILAILFATVVLFRAVLHRRPSSYLIFSGSIILYLCAVNDILNELKLIDTFVLMRLGLLVFILCQSWALARRFSKAFATSEKLFAEVQEKNIALSKLDRLKDEFLANTSHELRTPLNGIIGITEALLDGAAGKVSDKARANLRMVEHSGRRLARLVDEILDFARLKNSDVTLALRAVDLRASATAVTSVLERSLAGRDVAFEIRMSESLPPVLGDEDRIQQILYNLLGNAAKFTEKGCIVLSAEVSGEMVSVSVADTGKGIAEDRIDTIFEPFDQAEASAGGVGGTGLGLAITQNLVRLHGGRIQAESAPGRGATFTFTLPLVGADAAAATPHPTGTRKGEDLPAAVAPAAPPPVLAPAAPGGYRVLVVDDDPINLHVAANHLAAAGHEVRTAINGAVALDVIRSEEKPDLVLLDIVMPGMSGHEVCRVIREDHAPPALPVVMLTAAGRPESLVAGFAAGANDYLTKPFSGQELTARVNVQLQLKSAFETLAENVRLKRELTRRKETQQHLLLTQRRLSELLDTVGDAVLAVNEDHEITFCNRACRGLLGYRAEALLGRPVRTVATGQTVSRLETVIKSSEETSDNTWIPGMIFTRADGGTMTVDVLITSLDLDDEQLSVILIRAAAAGKPVQHPALPLITELNRHQQRLRTLEESLAAALHPETPLIRQGIEAVDAALDSVQQALNLQEKETDKSTLAVSVMNLSIDYWIESTGMDKFDLARQSGQWRVYTNSDGWERAQTLDKYLKTDTLPKKPRWKQVLATAEFVLTFCEAPSALRTRLEAVLLDLRKACR